MPRKYKDTSMDRLYRRLRELGTPDAIAGAGIYGLILTAFRMGFTGSVRPLFCTKGSCAWVAFYAGKDAGETQRNA